MGSFTRWYNYGMELYRVDPEIYAMLVCGFTTMSWGSILLFRKASQVKLEKRVFPITDDIYFPATNTRKDKE
jgi:hypothetical protein